MLITTKTADDFSTEACKSLHRSNDANDLHDKRRPQHITQHLTNRDELDDDIQALCLAIQPVMDLNFCQGCKNANSVP